MKHLLAFLLFLCSVGIMAQDVIVKKDGSTVVCRVVKVTSSEITYKKWTDLNGSSYIIDKSLVSAINYENGKKDTFDETKSQYKPNNQNDGVQAINDRVLLRMDAEANSSWTYKKVKRLRTWGGIGGGVLTVGGIILMGIGYSVRDGDHDNNYNMIGVGVAAGLLGLGVATTSLIVAHKQQKKLDALQTSSIYRQDFRFSNGSRLSVGADMLNDRIMNKKTIGLGLSYNF